MQALVKTETKNVLRIEEKSVPVLEREEVLVKVEYCGVCGSDLHAAEHATGYEFVPKPIILGHEISGRIIKIGKDVDESLDNSRVAIMPIKYCGECEQCHNKKFNICENIEGLGLHYDGGMAEYVKVKYNQILILPENLEFDIAALLEPLSVAHHAIERVSLEQLKNKKILVQGCGVIGLFTALIAKSIKADVTISGLPKDWEGRLSLAEELGIKTEIFEKEKIPTQKFDYIFECSGSSKATENIVNRIKKGGEIILVALYDGKIEFNVNILVRSEINIITSYSSLEKDFHKAIEILTKNSTDFKKIMNVYPLGDGINAFKDAQNKEVLKPILKMDK